MELLIFLVCFPCHVIKVAFGLSLGQSCSLTAEAGTVSDVWL